MNALKFDNLKKPRPKGNVFSDYTYVDIHLDLEYDRNGPIINKEDESTNRDLRISPDEHAIKNSLVNLFNTRPGQRILLPEYGTDLMGMLFESVSQFKGKALGNHILYAIEKWEKRVTVIKVKVIAQPEEHQYSLVIAVSIPSLGNKQTNLTGVITNEGFSETNSSEYI
jgi:hypothetical protein